MKRNFKVNTKIVFTDDGEVRSNTNNLIILLRFPTLIAFWSVDQGNITLQVLRVHLEILVITDYNYLHGLPGRVGLRGYSFAIVLAFSVEAYSKGGTWKLLF